MPWFWPGNEYGATDGFQQRPRTLDFLCFAASDNNKLFTFRGLGTAEYGRAQMALTSGGVRGGKFTGEVRADGAARNVDGALRKASGYAVFAENCVSDSVIVRQHGE